jgi:ketosteroid isomerase-like protein
MVGEKAMSEGERNKRIVRDILDEIGRGNLGKFRSRMADDIRYTITGSSPFSGTHTKQQWWEEVVQPLIAKLETSIHIELKNIIADGEYVFTHSQGTARTKDGRPYNHVYGHLWRLKNEMIVEIHEWLDTALTADIFSKRPEVPPGTDRR